MRRLVLSLLLGWALVGTPLLAAEKPNILILITDQQHWRMMSCAGEEYVHTPAMDSIAAAGTRFSLAYAANPVCSPSRVSMFTGYMPSRFGMKSNDQAKLPFPKSMLPQTMGHLLRRAGYETAFGGKTHWMRGMTPESLGFRDLGRNGRDGLADVCVQFLEEPHDKPFCLVASFINPHDICFMAIDAHAKATGKPAFEGARVEREELAKASALPAGVSREEFFEKYCPPLPSNFAIGDDEAECITTCFTQYRPFREYVRRNWTEEDWRMHRWAYRRLTERVDGQIGRVLGALRRSGQDRNTVIVFTSDHGDHDSAHHLEHKSIPYEEAARVPLIVAYPPETKPGAVDEEHLVNVGLDLIPTVCDYAGADVPAGLSGRSLRALAAGREEKAWREYVVSECKCGRMIRNDRFKYIVYESGTNREQLFDLRNDPGELHNLAVRAEYQDTLRQMRKALAEWMVQTNDPMREAYLVR
ncbi:MAG: DUF4976 domain-containing protein [Planctomycetota bacterium]|nr:MAG: DUF4976 domain-containing protein [Planctomycetota bacterium]